MLCISLISFIYSKSFKMKLYNKQDSFSIYTEKTLIIKFNQGFQREVIHIHTFGLNNNILWGETRDKLFPIIYLFEPTIQNTLSYSSLLSSLYTQYNESLGNSNIGTVSAERAVSYIIIIISMSFIVRNQQNKTFHT